MDKQLFEALTELLGNDGIVVQPGKQGRIEDWLSNSTMNAEVLLKPANTEQVAEALKLCDDYKQSVVPIGGTTGLVGGTRTTTQDVAISLERLNTIETINTTDRTVRVGAGVILQAIHDYVAEFDLEFPVTLGAKGSAQIGGIASTNAGGNNVLLHGMARNNILGVEAVLASGEIISSLTPLLKNNTGTDLKQLFIGSEGTLGIITRLDLKLVNRPPQTQSAFLGVNQFSQCLTILAKLRHMLNGQLGAFEVMWDQFYRIAANSDYIKRKPLSDDHNYYLLVEYPSPMGEAFVELFQSALMTLFDEGLIEDVVIANSEQERAQFWAIRENIDSLKVIEPFFAFDVSAPTHNMASYVETVHTSLKLQFDHVDYVVFGHIGDGNLHLFISVNDGSEEARKSVEKAVYDPIADHQGSISAEHAIGLEKKPYLALSRSAAELQMMKRLKQSLDPNGILNPGKVI